MYLVSVVYFPRIVGNVLGIRGGVNLLLWLGYVDYCIY